MSDLRKEQLRLQSISIEEFENKLEKVIDKKLKNKTATEDETFRIKYLKKISDEIHETRDKKLSTIVGKIFKHKYFKDEICGYYGKDKIDYWLEDKAKEIAKLIQDKIDDKSISYFTPKKDSDDEKVAKRTFEILKEFCVDIEKSKALLGLGQKEQIFTLASIVLSSQDIAWMTLKSIANLLQKELHSEDDNSTSRQAIINTIGEVIFEHVAFAFKKEGKAIQDWDNETEIDVGVEAFKYLIELDILSEYEKEGNFKNFKFSDSFEKESKNIYSKMIEFDSPSFNPMIVPPTNWTSIDDGGFLKDNNSSPKFDLYIMKATTLKDRQNVRSQKDTFSPKLLEAVNIIQQTSWQINSDVVDDIAKYLKSVKMQNKQDAKELLKEKKKRYKALKDKKQEVKAEKKANQKQVDKGRMTKEEMEEELLPIYREQTQMRELYEKALVAHSSPQSKLNIRNIIIEKAKKHMKYEKIYFVWQVDFRGRTYPAQPLLNPQGDDQAKSLLRFATPKPLGERGERWFKIHGANLYGEDKISFDDRVRWVDEHKQDIVDIFNNEDRFDSEFLRDADKPFSFLAFAYEYKRYVDNPEDFRSAIPIAMDGSNNGFQHITALLRDVNGAKKVNVIPNENQNTPSDIYKDVAEITKKLITQDNENYSIIKKINKESEKVVIKKELIDEIFSKIDRSLTKQNVMTEAYGAGAEAKLKQIKEHIESKWNLEWEEEDINDVSTYLRNKVAEGIKQELASSGVYKKWMKQIASKVSKKNQELRWITPIIGLEVIQEEFIQDERDVATKFNGIKNTIQIRVPTDKISKGEQSKAIAPNFIHSLDATHLFLTVMDAHKKGVDSFATIHDSFGTHSCDVDTLQKSIRDSFIDMFKTDIMQSLREYINKRYELELKSINYQGHEDEFEIQKVKDSLYFFS